MAIRFYTINERDFPNFARLTSFQGVKRCVPGLLFATEGDEGFALKI